MSRSNVESINTETNNDRKINANEIITLCARFIDRKIYDDLRALILIGSFSRREGLFCEENGKLRFISDIEFIAVVGVRAFARWRVLRFKIEKEVEEIVKKETKVEVKVSIGFTTIKHLPKLKPYIYTVEMKKYGRVLHGDAGILSNIPDFSYSKIDPLDGFILLNNRIVEQLIVLENIKKGITISKYDLFKGYLQIVNSILTIEGRYKSLYPAKRFELLRLIDSLGFLKQRLPFLNMKTLRAFSYIEKPNLLIIPVPKERAIVEWRNLRESFKAVWIYEARKLLKTDSFDLDKLMDEFVNIPRFMSRIKGWGKFAVRGGRKLPDLRSTPQYLIYQRAVRAYFKGEGDMAEAGRVVADWEKFVK